MIRNALRLFSSQSSRVLTPRVIATPHVARMSGFHVEDSEERFIERYIEGFRRPDLDHWWLTKYINDMNQFDAIPDPKLIIVVLEACRKLNDIAIAIRFLETVVFKCGNRRGDFMPYIMQEIGPTMEKLGIPTLEELGYDKPELYMDDDDVL